MTLTYVRVPIMDNSQVSCLAVSWGSGYALWGYSAIIWRHVICHVGYSPPVWLSICLKVRIVSLNVRSLFVDVDHRKICFEDGLLVAWCALHKINLNLKQEAGYWGQTSTDLFQINIPYCWSNAPLLFSCIPVVMSQISSFLPEYILLVYYSSFSSAPIHNSSWPSLPLVSLFSRSTPDFYFWVRICHCVGFVAPLCGSHFMVQYCLPSYSFESVGSQAHVF